MRVIAGQARGIPLKAPRGGDIRPTLDRVRESLFNILAPRIEGARFLDLFAGTGANGIEALSRGAASATFVDQDNRALSVIRDNLVKTRLEAGARCLRLRVPGDLADVPGPFDIVFADPPYAFEDYAGLIAGLAAVDLISEAGWLVLEHRRGAAVPETAGALTRFREKRYGSTLLTFFS